MPDLTTLMISLNPVTRCRSVQSEYLKNVKDEFLRQPPGAEEILTENDIMHLPLPVRKYIYYSGSVGKSKPQNVRIAFDAKMVIKPGAEPMNAVSEQFNFYGSFSRIFLMKASKMLIPIRARHVYKDENATFKVRIANLFNIVDVKGEELTTAETVTLLNDMCIFVPGSLYNNRLSWKEIDSLSSQVTIKNGKYEVSAILYFSDSGELKNFISDDRYASQADGTLKRARWSTPVRDFKEFDGRRVPTFGETIWNYPEGDFTYGTFRLKDIAYNVSFKEFSKNLSQ